MGADPHCVSSAATRKEIGEIHMAAINDLIAQIQDPILRAKIEQEANKLT